MGLTESDFVEIQDAVTVAAHGDLILVRPDHEYRSFTLDKGLAIRSTQARFTMDDYATIRIEGVPKGQTVGISGVELIPSRTLVISANDCSGDIVLDNVTLNSAPATSPFREFVNFTNCDLVHLSNVDVVGGILSESADAEFICTAINSNVVYTSGRMIGNSNYFFPWLGEQGDPGGSAFYVGENSRVVITHPNISGGLGQPGGNSDFPCPDAGDGGVGGTGIVASDSSQLMIIGIEGDFVEGGQGGPGGLDHDGYEYEGAGGDGGVGLIGNAEVSRVIVRGGERGRGSPYGENGLPYIGDLTDIEPFVPILDVPTNLRPGREFDVTITGRAGGNAKLVISNRRDWMEVPGIAGAPLAVIPGDFFFVIDAGTIGLTPLIHAVTLKTGIEITGSILTFQTIITSPSDGSITLSNAVSRVVGVE